MITESVLKAGRRAKSKTRLETKSRTGSRTGQESWRGIRIKNVIEIGIENEAGIEIDIDRYKEEKINSTSMLAELLRALTIPASDPQEIVEQLLLSQLVLNKFM
ncbi:hypothetical protein EVAR_4361_1 [Eumeta japonica]|uniref:Uncharacterized protein n=1 Tax=Eumeta variegata TaxID=151549 RepID=A0A4C1SGP6_EUMVA|nr:hypothetical protein EVAR_4361_1 [Eumeta japonica]